MDHTLIQYILQGDRWCWDTFGETYSHFDLRTAKKYIANLRENESLILTYMNKQLTNNEDYKDQGGTLSSEIYNLLSSCIKNKQIFVHFLLGGLQCQDLNHASIFFNTWIELITDCCSKTKKSTVPDELMNFCIHLHNEKYSNN